MRSNKFRKSRKTLKVPKAVKKYVNSKLDDAIEDKYSIGTMISLMPSVASSYTSIALCNYSNGTGVGERVGRRVRIKKIVIDGWVAPGDNTNLFRMIVCSAENGSVFAAGGNSIDTCFHAKNATSGILDHIYYDKTIFLKHEAIDGNSGTSVPILRHVRIVIRPNFTIRWSDNTSNYYDHMLFLSCVSDSAAPSNPGFVNGYLLTTFEDA